MKKFVKVVFDKEEEKLINDFFDLMHKVTCDDDDNCISCPFKQFCDIHSLFEHMSTNNINCEVEK